MSDEQKQKVKLYIKEMGQKQKVEFYIKEMGRNYEILSSDKDSYDGYVIMRKFTPHVEAIYHNTGDILASVSNMLSGYSVDLTISGDTLIIDKRDSVAKEYTSGSLLPKDIQSMILNGVDLNEYDILVENDPWYSLVFYHRGNNNKKVIDLEQVYENQIPQKPGKLIKRLCRLLNWFEKTH